MIEAVYNHMIQELSDSQSKNLQNEDPEQIGQTTYDIFSVQFACTIGQISPEVPRDESDSDDECDSERRSPEVRLPGSDSEGKGATNIQQ